MSIFEGDEFGTPNTSDRFVASKTSFGEELSKAFSAIGLFFTTCETFSCETLGTMGTSEAFPMPWFILVGHTTTSYDLIAFDAPCGEFLFVTFRAIDFLLSWYEALSSNRNLAYAAAETFLMPLPGFVFHFLGSGPKYFVATIASRSKLIVIATTTVDPFTL